MRRGGGGGPGSGTLTNHQTRGPSLRNRIVFVSSTSEISVLDGVSGGGRGVLPPERLRTEGRLRRRRRGRPARRRRRRCPAPTAPATQILPEAGGRDQQGRLHERRRERQRHARHGKDLHEAK